jgi:hypothetical protein
MSEQRRIQRQGARRAVRIPVFILREAKPNLRCTLVDISETGARLIVHDVSTVPDRFTMAMTEQGVPRRQCRLVWRGAKEVGVSFEVDKSDSESWNRELTPGSTRDDAIDAFALQKPRP